MVLSSLSKQLDESDLEGLVDLSSENQTLDFKEYAYPEPPEENLSSDPKDRGKAKAKWKESLCKDISAFANANGGLIICGMKEKDGTATELCGLGATINIEEEIARLEQVAMTGIEPRVPGLLIYSVALADKGNAIVIRIPRSFAAPHRVKVSSKFYLRRSNRNDEMNLDELRTAFTFAERIVEQIKEFRSSRIDALAASGHEDIPVNLADGPRMVLHLVPLTIADPGNRITFTSLDFVSKVFKVDGEWIHSKYARPNLDGVLMPKAPDSEGHINEYYQVFRSGACEYVQVYPLDSGQNKILNTLKKENHAIQSLKYLLGFHKELGINLPAAVMLTFVGIKGYQLIPNSDCRPYAQNNPSKGLLNKTNLLLPDVIVDTFSSKPEIILKPIFDVLCNAGGWNRSMSYDNVGNWIREE